MALLHTYLVDTYGDNVRYAYRHYPLSFHEHALPTAEASEAAAAQGKFFEMHDLLFERQNEWNQLTSDELQTRLVEYADELGLDTERFAQEMADHVYLAKVQAQGEEAINAQLPGTPTYIVSGIEYPVNDIGLSYPYVFGFIKLLELVPDQYTEVPPTIIESGESYVATIETNKGDIVVELYAEQAPVNVNNFAFLAQEGWYEGQSFFYVDPASAAYIGDPTNMGWGLPFVGYICGNEISGGLTFDEPGVVGFYAPAAGRNSSIFFITLAPMPDFNGKFTPIGKVVEGMDVVQGLEATNPSAPMPDSIQSIRVEKR